MAVLQVNIPNRIGSRRTAAKMRVGDWGKL